MIQEDPMLLSRYSNHLEVSFLLRITITMPKLINAIDKDVTITFYSWPTYQTLKDTYNLILAILEQLV